MLIWLLLCCKAAAVDSVVDTGIHPLVHRINLLPQLLWVQVQLRVLCHVVEGAVEDAQDLAALVVDDGACLLVPQHGHGVLAYTAREPRAVVTDGYQLHSAHNTRTQVLWS